MGEGGGCLEGQHQQGLWEVVPLEEDWSDHELTTPLLSKPGPLCVSAYPGVSAQSLVFVCVCEKKIFVELTDKTGVKLCAWKPWALS